MAVIKKRARSARKKSTVSRVGLILFAHGSRSAQWRKPFDRLLKDVVKQGGAPAVLAFGEFMPPTLQQAAQELADQGIRRAVIVPLFLGGGAHVRGDAPRLAREAQAASGVKLKVAKTVGEDRAVLAAMARYCVSKNTIKSNTYKITASSPRTRA